eukprot:5083972-Pleurochrysis_carterae.AAC.2
MHIDFDPSTTMHLPVCGRRVPEAQTFTEGTIADLKPAPASASTGEAVEMETEEEQLLRQAGIKSKKSLAAASAGPTIVTKARSKPRALQATRAAGSASV